jgi:hypothetical protein
MYLLLFKCKKLNNYIQEDYVLGFNIKLFFSVFFKLHLFPEGIFLFLDIHLFLEFLGGANSCKGLAFHGISRQVHEIPRK